MFWSFPLHCYRVKLQPNKLWIICSILTQLRYKPSKESKKNPKPHLFRIISTIL